MYVVGVGTGSGPPPPTSAPQNSARLDNCEINKYTVGGGGGGGVAPHLGGSVGK